MVHNVLESIIEDKTVDFFTENELINDTERSYRKGHSCLKVVCHLALVIWSYWHGCREQIFLNIPCLQPSGLCSAQIFRADSTLTQVAIQVIQL